MQIRYRFAGWPLLSTLGKSKARPELSENLWPKITVGLDFA